MEELERLIEKSTISLKPFNFADLSSVENLLRNIAEMLPGRIDYQATYRKTLHDSREESSDGEKKLTGMISRQEGDYEFTSFSIIYDFPGERFVELKFQTIPGYNLEEHRPGERKLWDDVRKIIEEYSSKYNPH